MKLKRYEQFVNEEINFKKALIGGAIAASTLTGCDDAEMSKRQGGEWHNDQTVVQTDIKPIELPNKFEMDEVVLTIGTDMNINVDGEKIGKVEERSLSWGKKFEYFDNTDKKVAWAQEKVFSWGTNIEVFDDKGTKIGSFEEEILESLFSIKSVYSIKDASGNLIGKSEKLEFFSTDVEILTPSGDLVCKIHRPAFNLISDSWNIEISGNIDKRLVVFIPCYKTSADNERRAEEDEKDRK